MVPIRKVDLVRGKALQLRRTYDNGHGMIEETWPGWNSEKMTTGTELMDEGKIKEVYGDERSGERLDAV